MDIPLERETPVDPGESVELVVNVPSLGLETGLYRFVVKVNATDRAGRPVKGSAELSFELRPGSAEAQPEILRREALRRVAKEDYIGAREAVADLLQIHPNSVHAYGILATIATKEGKNAEAATHRATADAISRAGRDQLLEKYKSKRRSIAD